MSYLLSFCFFQNLIFFSRQLIKAHPLVSLKFEIISIFPHLKPTRKHAGFNGFFALNSTSQFIKDDLFFTCCPAILHCAAGQVLLRKVQLGLFAQGSRLRVTAASVRDAPS